MFNFAFAAASVANLARLTAPLTSDENGLIAGWPLSSGPHPAPLNRPITLHGGATITQAGADRDNLVDAALLPVPAPQTPLKLLSPADQVWACGQSVDDPTGSGNYRVLTGGPQAGEQDWRWWCSRCQGLFRGPGTRGVCPARGTHDPTGSGGYRFDPLVQLG